MLGAWNGTAAADDLIALPAGVTFTLEPGSAPRSRASTTEVRALEAPDQSCASQRRPLYHDSLLRLRLNFATAYAGTLHLYALDWDKVTRRQTVTVIERQQQPDDRHRRRTSTRAPGCTSRSTSPAGGALTITVNDTGTSQCAWSAGLFLGGPAHATAPAPAALRGGAPGRLGGHLRWRRLRPRRLEWDRCRQRSDRPAGGRDLHPRAGSAHALTASTTDVRALEAPTRACAARDLLPRQLLRLRLNFANPTPARYTSTPSTGTGRSTPDVTVTNGTGTQTVAISDAFNQGAWLHFPVNVAAGGALTITVNDTGTPNVLVAGLFLGGARHRHRRHRRHPTRSRLRATGWGPTAATATSSAPGTGPPPATI